MEQLEIKIDELHLKDLCNEVHPSIFDENDDYDMLIIRLPLIDQTLEVKSFGFVITAEHSYEYDKEAKTFKPFADRFEALHTRIDKISDRLLKAFGRYQELTVDMEEHLYLDKTMKHFMTDWLGLKRDILRIERVLLRASQTMEQVIESYEHEEGFPINHYLDLHEHLDRTTRSATLQLSKLDYLYSFFSARTNERMNRLIYFLTIISAVFLPLNLVVGFFGMNTSGLPFAEGSSGTLNAILLMLSLVVITSLVVYVWHRNTAKS